MNGLKQVNRIDSSIIDLIRGHEFSFKGDGIIMII